MFKAVFALRRKEGMSQAAFRDFWLNDHAPKVAKIPGLRRYVIDIGLTEDASRSVDGYATVWFDDEKAFQAGFGGDYARTVVLPNNSNFNRFTEIIMLPVGEYVIIG
jgi:uncharacterized protein (TIGR02118 family)